MTTKTSKIFLIIIFYIFNCNFNVVNGTSKEELLVPIKHFDWTEAVEISPMNYNSIQVLHPVGKYKPYQDDLKATEFVKKHLKNARSFDTDADTLRFASDSISIKNGFFLEMGVATGRSINFIAALNPKLKIYGFDSFEGLPQDWDRGDVYSKRGTFGFKKKSFDLPLLKNVIAYKGLFKDVLPKFKTQILKNHPIAFLHMDSDIYQSAKEVLDILGDNIVKGTVILFDEL